MNNQLQSNFVVTDFPIEIPDKIPEKFYSTSYKSPNVNPPSANSPSPVPVSSPINNTSTNVLTTVTENTGSNKTKYILMAVGAIATGALLYVGYTQRKRIMSAIKSLIGINKQIESSPADVFLLNSISIIQSAELSELDCNTSNPDACEPLDYSYTNTGANMTLALPNSSIQSINSLGNGMIGVF